MAAETVDRLDLRELWHPGAVFRRLWHAVEHVFDWRKVSRLLASVEVDVMPAL
jgi:hypothetical protein